MSEMKVIEENLHYLAGVIDIAGFTTFSKKRSGWQLKITGDLRILNEIHSIIGSGSVQPPRKWKGYNRRPCPIHCKEPHEHVIERTFSAQYTLTGTALSVVLNTLEPMLARFEEFESIIIHHANAIRGTKAAESKIRNIRAQMQSDGWDADLSRWRVDVSHQSRSA